MPASTPVEEKYSEIIDEEEDNDLIREDTQFEESADLRHNLQSANDALPSDKNADEEVQEAYG